MSNSIHVNGRFSHIRLKHSITFQQFYSAVKRLIYTGTILFDLEALDI